MENRLQERRLELGLTQGQVSARLKEKEPRADVGMVSRYEQGVCLPTRAQIEVLEEIYNQSRTELYRIEDLDLVGYLPISGDKPPAPECERGQRVEPPSHLGRVRKCYRIRQQFAASLPDDLLDVCGYSSWQSWHDACLKRLLGEYGAKKKATKVKEEKTA